MIIQTILLYPSGAVWIDRGSNVSRQDPSGAVQSDAEHPARNRKVEDEAYRSVGRFSGDAPGHSLSHSTRPYCTEPDRTHQNRSLT
jgi:hypothetical protein